MTQEQLFRLNQIYIALNQATGQVRHGEPLTHGQTEVIGHSLVLFWNLLNELLGISKEEAEAQNEWDYGT